MSDWPGDSQQETTPFGGLSRGELMSRVPSNGNQTTEKRLAALLRESGVPRWKEHQALPGRPDFVWPKSKVAVFVDGCFWHGHDCGKNISPKTNAQEWRNKIERNMKRDRAVNRILRKEGWHVIRIWECKLAKYPNRCVDRIIRYLEFENAE